MGAVSMSVFGFSDFAAKFPAALCGFLLIVLIFFLARELTTDFLTPIIAAWVLMLTQYFMKYSTHAMSDVPFALFFTLAIFLYIKGLKAPRFLVLCGLAIASAIMTRTVLGGIPAAVIVAHIILTRRYDVFRSKSFLIGGLLVLALPMTWYIYSYRTHGPAFLQGHFSFIWTKVVSESGLHWQDFLLGLFTYPGLLIKMYQPWLILAVVGLVWQVKKVINERDSSAMLLVLWVLFVLLPFSLVSAKVLRYIMPVFPAVAILAAIPLSRWLPKLIGPRFRTVAFFLLCSLVVIIAVFPNPRHRAEDVLAITPAIQSGSQPGERLVLYTNGERRDDLVNQFLWYSDRYFHYFVHYDELNSKMRSGELLGFVVDRETFEERIKDSGLDIDVVGKTDKFVLFRVN
jgi:4-amino-4-deoxy-L-arabinose transferase-like glycosyltransferase